MLTNEDKARIDAFKVKYQKNPDAAMREIDESIAKLRMDLHDTHNRFVYENLKSNTDAVSPAPSPVPSPTDEREITQ